MEVWMFIAAGAICIGVGIIAYRLGFQDGQENGHREGFDAARKHFEPWTDQ